MDDEPYYDLLPQNENAMFRVVFDLFTPRPHFIILPKIGAIGNDFSSMTKEQTSSLIKAARSMLSSFNISKSTLSIHRGSWKSRDSNSFHAHICVDTEIYLQIFEQRQGTIPNWPSDEWVTNQWQSRLPQSYPENVRDYEHVRARFFWQDVRETERLIRFNDPGYMAEDIRVPDSLPRDVRLMCHTKHPKIAFLREIHDPDPITAPHDRDMFLTTVLMAMEEFANACGVTNLQASNSNKGCHLCLHLSSGTSKPLFLTLALKPVFY